MKKLMFATALAASAAAFAAPINAISFEGYSVNDQVGNTDDVGGATAGMYFYFDGQGDGSFVKTFDGENLPTPQITRPLYFASASPNAKYLELNTEGGTLWRSIDTVNSYTVGETTTYSNGNPVAVAADGTYFDSLVQFTPTEDNGAPELDGADKLAIWLNVDGNGVTNLMVKAGSYDDEGALAVGGASYVLSGKTIVDKEWYRLTVKAVDNILPANEYYKVPGFQVFIDGVEMSATTSPLSAVWLASLEEGEVLSAAQVTELSSGKYLPSLLAGENGVTSTLQGVGFKGSGAIDDIVWTTDDPFAGGAGGDTAWIDEVTDVFVGTNLSPAQKTAIATWASDNGITVASGSEEIAAAAYLLNLTTLPTAIPDLTITSIEEGESAWTLTVAASVSDQALALPAAINGAVMLKQAATLAGLASANAATATFTIANGTATVTVAKDADAAKFMRVSVGIAPAANNAQQE